jgi:hypothetical protein
MCRFDRRRRERTQKYHPSDEKGFGEKCEPSRHLSLQEAKTEKSWGKVYLKF